MINPFKAKAFVATAALVFAFAAAQSAQADTIKLNVDSANYTGGNGAGEYKVGAWSGGSVPTMGSGVNAPGGVFQTFCVESNESIVFNTTYNYTASTSAVAGGYSGGNPDALDAKTAYLYTQFWNGTLSGYTYTQGSGRVASATSLQLALWKIEGEIQPGALTTAYNNDTQAQAWVSAATSAVSAGTWTGIGNVRILNLTDVSTGANIQSVLAMLAVVPLPSALMLGFGLMSAMGAASVLKRRNRRVLA